LAGQAWHFAELLGPPPPYDPLGQGQHRPPWCPNKHTASSIVMIDSSSSSSSSRHDEQQVNCATQAAEAALNISQHARMLDANCFMTAVNDTLQSTDLVQPVRQSEVGVYDIGSPGGGRGLRVRYRRCVRLSQQAMHKHTPQHCHRCTPCCPWHCWLTRRDTQHTGAVGLSHQWMRQTSLLGIFLR
jgi:hypothetical protein